MNKDEFNAVNKLHKELAEVQVERDAAIKREQALAAHVERLDNELQDKALTDDGVLADAYWNCVDKITPWLGDKTGSDTLINSVCESLDFLIEQWREKKKLEQERDEALMQEQFMKDAICHVEAERDAVIVKAAALRDAMAYGSDYLDQSKLSAIENGSKAHQEMRAALDLQLDTSILDRRDALKQAEACEEIKRSEGGQVAAIMDTFAKKYRKKAEGANNA